MMLVALLLAVAAARPQDEPIKILKQTQEHDTESGKYSFRLESVILIPHAWHFHSVLTMNWVLIL